jgi:hypothetical protein
VPGSATEICGRDFLTLALRVSNSNEIPDEPPWLCQAKDFTTQISEFARAVWRFGRESGAVVLLTSAPLRKRRPSQPEIPGSLGTPRFSSD